ncbi:MAG: AAA family ATPase [Spirochaetaceae bacterium]|jgi:predicted ATPase|nr:AAA family ATPase [Spirochaetaceae bacterium]
MDGMIIEALHVKNVRLFTELNIAFNPKFTFLAGPNGCGKTSVLACLAHCFSTDHFDYSRFSGDAELWADISDAGKQYRVGLGEGAIKQQNYRNSRIQQWVAPPPVNGRMSINPANLKKTIKTPPLFIGSQRNLVYKQIQGIQREKSIDETRIDYSTKSLSFLYGADQINIKQWIINRYFMIEKGWAAQEKKNWEHFISNLQRIAPFGSAFSYVRTGRDFEPVFSLYGKECYLEELSAGYQAVLSILINIIAWVEGCMEEANRDIQTASGTVCIDEPDIHLHPEWQLTLRQGLVSFFPNLQFIVTTHSPHLLASAEAGEIIRMPKAYTEACYDLVPDDKAYSGWTTDEILADVMEVASLDNKDYERLVAAAMQAFEAKDIAALEEAAANLERVSHPDNTIVTVLRTKLASLELMKND